jgi:hypothetical protein
MNNEVDNMKSLKDTNTKILVDSGIIFISSNNGLHLIVEGCYGYIDFWPSTGKWIDRKTQESGIGAGKLLEFITE